MRFLLPVGGVIDHRFGILTSYKHTGIPIGIVEKMEWLGDNNCFNEFDPVAFGAWLCQMAPYAASCIGVVVPDVVADAARTVQRFYRWSHRIRHHFPIAFVAQDGQESLRWPLFDFDVLFIGGSTEWKLSEAAYSVIQRAQALDKHIHIGRVNNWRRYAHFRAMEGSEDWTCDGTKTRFIGTQRAVALWADYMERDYQTRFAVPFGNHSS